MTGEFEAIAERSRLMAELLEVIVGNEKKVSKKIRGQMTIYLKFRKEHMGLESRKDEEVWGFLSIIEEKVEEERLRYFSAMVLSQVQTYIDSAAVVTRQRNVATDGFSVKLQEEQAADGTHATETVGYLAIGAGIGPTHEAAVTDDSIKQNWSSIS